MAVHADAVAGMIEKFDGFGDGPSCSTILSVSRARSKLHSLARRIILFGIPACSTAAGGGDDRTPAILSRGPRPYRR